MQALLGAAAAVLLIAGCGTQAAGDEPAPPHPTGRPAAAPCRDGGDLVADLDGDGHTDRVTDPSGIGKKLSIDFSGGRTVGPRDLVGDRGKNKADVLAAVADFNADGRPDLAVVATGTWQGDDPIEPTVAELRLGPFSASGRGQRTHHLDLGETRGVSVADENHDRYPDLAVFEYQGDGVYGTAARLGSPRTGLSGADAAEKYTKTVWKTDDPSPRSMPKPGIPVFYKTC